MILKYYLSGNGSSICEREDEVAIIALKSNKTRLEKRKFVAAVYAIAKSHEPKTGIPAALFAAQMMMGYTMGWYYVDAVSGEIKKELP